MFSASMSGMTSRNVCENELSEGDDCTNCEAVWCEGCQMWILPDMMGIEGFCLDCEVSAGIDWLSTTYEVV